MSSLSTHHCVLAEDFANTKTAFSLCLASSLTFWVSVLRVLDSDRPPTSLPCPSPGLRSTPCQRRVRSALPPHRNEKKSLALTNPHPRPSCLPSPSATAPPILTDDNDFRPIYTPHRRGGTRKLRTVRGDALVFGFSLAAEPLQQPRPRGQPRTHADHA